MSINNLQCNNNLDLTTLKDLADNSMLKNYPNLYSIWDFEKNMELNILTVTRKTKTKAWWFCYDCGNSYLQRIDVKTSGGGCSICKGKIIAPNTCLNFTHPELSSLLVHSEDGEKYSFGSDKKVDWQCPQCHTIIRNKAINKVSKYGLSCSLCSDGSSYSEKIVSYILQKNKVEYLFDSKLYFSNDKRYDFYIEKYNMIIEVHGLQHYSENGFITVGGRTLEEEQENDYYKEKIALSNGIENYIVINAQKSELSWLRKSIESSNIKNFLDIEEIDWKEAHKYAVSSKKIQCLNMYLKGNADFNDMAKTLKVHYSTILQWLREWSQLGKCDYKPFDSSKAIVQLDSNMGYVKRWNSGNETKKHFKNVFNVLTKKRSNDQGFVFMYEDEYEKYLVNPELYKKRENKVKKPIVQLDKDMNLIKIWSSIQEATEHVGLKNSSSISLVCRKEKKTAKGFYWMYLSEYEKNRKKE